MNAPDWLPEGLVKATCSACWGTGEIYPAPLKPKLAVNPEPCPTCRGGDVVDPGIVYARGESGKLSGEPDPPCARQGAFEYLLWLESDMRFDKWFDVPFAVRFPFGWNHWLTDLVEVSGTSPTCLDMLRKQVRLGDATGDRWEAELRAEQRKNYAQWGIPDPVPEGVPEWEPGEPSPELLARLVHAAYLRVTPESIADWWWSLIAARKADVAPPDDARKARPADVRAYIEAEAAADVTLRAARDLILSRLAGEPVKADDGAGKGAKRGRGRPVGSTRTVLRNAYIKAALSALYGRFSGTPLARPLRYQSLDGAENDWFEVVATAFEIEPETVRSIWLHTGGLDPGDGERRARIKGFHNPRR